jgi:hypothetical protein
MTIADERDVRARLIGSWELVTWQSIGQDDTIGYPLGEDAVGQLMYDDDADRVCAQLVRVNQPRFASEDWQEATGPEMAAAWPNYFGYFGTFTIDTAAATVTHHIDAGWFPNLVGTQQVRHYRFANDQLVLDADTTWGKVRIVWTKLPRVAVFTDRTSRPETSPPRCWERRWHPTQLR